MEPRTVADRRDDLWLLDVRETWEWQAGHIEGATHIPMDQLGARLAEVPTDATVVAVCRSGARSDQVAQALRQREYDAHNLDGGVTAWHAADLPLVAEGGGAGQVV